MSGLFDSKAHAAFAVGEPSGGWRCWPPQSKPSTRGFGAWEHSHCGAPRWGRKRGTPTTRGSFRSRARCRGGTAAAAAPHHSSSALRLLGQFTPKDPRSATLVGSRHPGWSRLQTLAWTILPGVPSLFVPTILSLRKMTHAEPHGWMAPFASGGRGHDAWGSRGRKGEAKPRPPQPSSVTCLGSPGRAEAPFLTL